MSILAFRFICDISFLFLCRFLLLFIFRHLRIICSCCSLNFYGRSGGVRTAFIAPNIFILLHFFFILSFYISLSPNHYFVISNGSFLPSGLLCCKCNYFRLTNAKTDRTPPLPYILSASGSQKFCKILLHFRLQCQKMSSSPSVLTSKVKFLFSFRPIPTLRRYPL